MTRSEVKQKIDSINYYRNKYIHNGACNLCVSILNSNEFSNEIKIEVKKVKLELQGLQEPWGYGNRTSPDFSMLSSICNCLNHIYGLME